MAIKPIEILINAKDNASSVFSSLQGKVAAVGAAIAAYFGINAFVGIVRGAADLEQGMSRVQAATGATAEEMQALRKAAEDAGANTKYTSTEAAAALENLAKAGLGAGDAIEALPAVLALAQAGDVGLAESAEFVTKAVMGMGLAFSDAGRVADVLALGANATNTSVTGLAQALSYAAPVAQSAGVSLEGTVAIMGKLADAGIDASRSGTAVANMLAQFSDPASSFKRALADAGITTNNFEDALRQLAASGARGEKAILAVGLNAGPALRALLNQGMPALDELKVKLEGAAGSAAAAAKVMGDNLKGSMTGLSSAWDTVKNTLGTPVLPVLKDGVDQLAGAFRSAVADGTIGKFGNAIATAFQAGIKWVREFIGQVDFDAVTVRMQEFADGAKQRFDEFGKYATNAGNIVKTAYGALSAGANTVLAGIYGLGIAFAETAKGIVGAAASMSEALSKVAIGDAKQRLIQEAAQMREVLTGLTGVSEEFGRKTREALDDAAAGAQLARDGFVGLKSSVEQSDDVTTTASKAMAVLADELSKGAAAAAAAGAAYQKKINDEQMATQAATVHKDAIAKLREEYADLVASGNLQAATKKLGEINNALQGTAPAAKDAAKAAADAAAQIEAAFGRLGVTSSAALKEQADNARRDYELIKKSGTSTAEDLQRSFEKSAQAAIAANKGIAPSWVEAEAAARGYKVVTDSAGQSTLELADKTEKATGRMARGWHASREAIQAQEAALDKLMMKYTMSADYTERQIRLLEREAAAAEKAAEAYRKKWNMDKEGYSLNTAGDRVLAGESQDKVDRDIADRYGAENIDNPDAQRARQLRALAQLRGKGNGLVRQPDLSAAERRELQQLEARLLNGVGEQSGAERNGSAGSPGGSYTTAQPTTVVNLNYNGQQMGVVSTDAAGRASLEKFLQALADGKSTTW